MRIVSWTTIITDCDDVTTSGQIEVADDLTDEEIDELVREEVYSEFSWDFDFDFSESDVLWEWQILPETGV